MGTDNLNNRAQVLSPEIIAQMNSDIAINVQDLAAQFMAALRERPDEMMAAREKYFGN